MKERLPAPDMHGSAGRAWRYDIAAIADGRKHASLESWLVEVRGAHPLWHSYVLNLIHLREMEGMAPAKMYVVGATHEMTLAAANFYFLQLPECPTPGCGFRNELENKSVIIKP